MNEDPFDSLLTRFLADRSLQAPFLSDEARVAHNIASRTGPPARIQMRALVRFPRFVSLLAPVALLVALTAAVTYLGAAGDPSTKPTSVRNGLIAFDSGGDIWVAEPDGTGVRQLTSDAAAGRGRGWGPVWSPDGSMLAYTRDGSGSDPASLVVIDADGQVVTTVAQLGQGFCTCRTEDPAWSPYDWRPSWAPDGRRLAYSIFVPKGYGYHSVFIRALDATHSETLVPSGPDPLEQGTGPAWSPDEGRIAFIWHNAPGPLVVMSADDREPQHVVSASASEPSWSPDGRLLAYAVGSEDDYDIAVADADGTGERIIASEPTDQRWPAWSPDGRRIAYVRADADTAAYHVVVVDVAQGEGSGRVLDIPGLVSAPPIWSPDGSHLAVWVQSIDGGGRGGLTLVDLTDATLPVRIPADSETFRASWQSKGKRVDP